MFVLLVVSFSLSLSLTAAGVGRGLLPLHLNVVVIVPSPPHCCSILHACPLVALARSSLSLSLSLSLSISFLQFHQTYLSNFSLCNLSSSSEQREKFTNESSFFVYFLQYCTPLCRLAVEQRLEQQRQW